MTWLPIAIGGISGFLVGGLVAVVSDARRRSIRRRTRLAWRQYQRQGRL